MTDADLRQAHKLRKEIKRLQENIEVLRSKEMCIRDRIYLAPYSVKGDEIIPTYCPYCKGGKRKDKYTFALNTRNLTFNCKRGSCGKQGLSLIHI